MLLAPAEGPAIGRTADKADYKISKLLFRRIWRLAKPYWVRRKGVWRPRTIVTVVLLFVPLFGAVGVALTYVTKDMTNALIAKHAAAYWSYFGLLVICGVSMQTIQIGMTLLQSWMTLDWRKWLTTHLIDQYLAKRTYYDIALAEDLDNPDQRIQENVSAFIGALTSFPTIILLSITTLLAGIFVLVTVDPAMAPVAVVFGIVQGVTLYFAYTPTIRRNFNIMLAEADFRYSILHVRDHAEAIAFYSGESAERATIVARLGEAVRRQFSLAKYNAFVVTATQEGFGLVWSYLPYLILVPLFFAGHLSYGSIAQAVAASTGVLGGIRALITALPMIAASAPPAVRLAQIQERFDQMEARQASGPESQLAITHTSDSVHLQNLTLQTPGGEQTLIRNLNLRIDAGENLVIVGQTGVGKSSLLRAVAGLWTRGNGLLEMPPTADCLFLPQRPYMVLADLRSQLLYPDIDRPISDAELQDAMEAVQLPDLAVKYGGLSTVRDWGKVLSLGEQQRIGFARVLLCRPKFVFLDEATSAVDFATETQLYKMLYRSGANYISVGHRLSIIDYHTHVLTLMAGGAWKVEPLTGDAMKGAKDFLAS